MLYQCDEPAISNYGRARVVQNFFNIYIIYNLLLLLLLHIYMRYIVLF